MQYRSSPVAAFGKRQQNSRRDICPILFRVISTRSLNEGMAGHPDGRIGLDLFQEGSDRGVTFLAKETSNISLCLNINRKKINDDDRDSFTDFRWYFNNIIKKWKKAVVKLEALNTKNI